MNWVKERSGAPYSMKTIATMTPALATDGRDLAAALATITAGQQTPDADQGRSVHAARHGQKHHPKKQHGGKGGGKGDGGSGSGGSSPAPCCGTTSCPTPKPGALRKGCAYGGQDFSGGNLRGAQFPQIDGRGSTWTGADLRGALEKLMSRY